MFVRPEAFIETTKDEKVSTSTEINSEMAEKLGLTPEEIQDVLTADLSELDTLDIIESGRSTNT